ncbi:MULTISPECIES: helix-turn-helix domain-containing protein [unclassified Archaeoglobus]|uniref:helix-turn-helix domain-containing protein n=1 Tax=unclassified Archaeoglobus TaxID=2643606 RepID=UPI0025BE0202|nr:MULTISPECIES: helix-turn-helix domain-containing protein [unclassified Archaeoglobus]
MSQSCEPHLKCVLKCALDISCLDMDIYLLLLKNPGNDVEFVAESLKKDESTVYKSLRNLMDKGLVKREYRILKSGGYKYLYYPVEFEEFKRIARKSIDEWFKNFESMLKSFEELEKEELIDVAVMQ